MMLVGYFFSIVGRVPFRPDPSTKTVIILTSIDYLFDLCFLVGIYLKCNFSPPRSDATGTMKKAQIRAQYQRGWQYYDLCASFPTYYLQELFQTIQSFFVRHYSTNVSYSVVGLFRVLFVFLMCCHFGGSVFYAIAYYEKSPVGWLQTDIVAASDPGNVGIAYLRAFYWAMSSFTVINYEDIFGNLRGDELGIRDLPVRTVGGEIVEIFNSFDKSDFDFRLDLENFRHFAHMNNLTSS
uniref:Ion transport domain-containing protein n=1 Tax=Globisporangium ultimum (strain ATCC 200006 / CBS 805.95 / DAOM BR144) TaxID=431595 RepID=K3X6Y3_GLOUD